MTFNILIIFQKSYRNFSLFVIFLLAR